MLSNLLELVGLVGLTVGCYLAWGLAPAVFAGSVCLLFLGYSLDGVTLRWPWGTRRRAVRPGPGPLTNEALDDEFVS